MEINTVLLGVRDSANRSAQVVNGCLRTALIQKSLKIVDERLSFGQFRPDRRDFAAKIIHSKIHVLGLGYALIEVARSEGHRPKALSKIAALQLQGDVLEK